ncbi:MAG: NADH:ubiquinone oxidoreductase subunit 6 (subunit J) [Flavobacteriaceae bacterium]|jgi:NADH:ubiquinone oxidoreductase subunit 6 (subunit J)
MTMTDVLIIVFTAMTVLPVLYLLFTKDVIRAAFGFVLSLLGIAGLYVLLNSELMAVVQLLIYAGGVIVLLLFGIMLTKRTGDEGIFTGHRNVWLSSLVVLLLGGMLFRWLITASRPNADQKEFAGDQVREIGVLFLTDYIIAFEVIAVLLLVALVGASFLANKSSQK